VRVSRARVFSTYSQRLLPPERCLEAYHLHRTRLELIAERKGSAAAFDRGRQHRDHRSRSGGNGKSGGAIPRPIGFPPGRFMRARANKPFAKPSAGFLSGVRIAVPPEGLGSRLDQIIAWARRELRCRWVDLKPHRVHEASSMTRLAVYFLDATDREQPFVARWVCDPEGQDPRWSVSGPR